MEKYYLSSLENKQLSYVRECQFIRRMKFDTSKIAVIVKLNEPIQWQNSEGFHGSEYAIITARHEGYDVVNINAFDFDSKTVKAYDTSANKSGFPKRDLDNVSTNNFDRLIIIKVNNTEEN